MFNFFKKKKRSLRDKELTETDRAFLNAIANALQAKYPSIKRQVDAGAIAGITERFVYGEGTFYYSIDGELSKKTRDRVAGDFKLMNIEFLNKSGKPEQLNLYVMEGLVYGYQCSTLVENLDLSTFQDKNSWIKIFRDDDYETISHFFEKYDKSFLDKLDLGSVFKIELNDAELYTIKNLQDGNYLAINLEGQIFELIHDPYIVKKVFENVEELHRSGLYG